MAEGLSPEEKAKRVARLVDEISKKLKGLGEEDYLKGFDLTKLGDADAQIKSLEDTLGGVNERIKQANSDFESLAKTIQAANAEFQNGNNALRESQKSYRNISSIATRLRNDALGISELNARELSSLTTKLEIERESLKISTNQLKQDIADGKLEGKKLEQAEAFIKSKEADFHLTKGLVDQAHARLKEEEKIEKIMGLTGNLLGGMEKSLTKLGFSSTIFSNATEKGREAAKRGANSFKVMAIQLFEIGKGIGKALLDPLSLSVIAATSLVALFKTMKDLIFSFSQESVDLGRNFGTAGDQAQRITAELRTMAATSDFLKGELIEGFTELNQAAGTFGQISKDNLETYVGLTKRAGYSKELAQDLYKLSVLQGKSLKETADIELKRIKSFAKSNNLAINQKDVFEEIGKMSAATQLSILGQGKALGDAAIQAKKLGMDMQTLNGIADSLLDFENSIAAEMEAELLTGRQLNLERARAAALSNDMATLGKELEKQNITAATFSKQNRLQQEATAKALGLSRDALAESLLKQEAIRRGIIQEGEVSLDQQLKQLSLQEKYNNIIENLKEIFVNQLQPVIKDITSFLSNEENYKGLVEGVKSMAKGFGEFMGAVTKAPDLLKKMEIAAISIAVALAAAALASSIATGGIATAVGTAAFAGVAGLGTYAAMGGFGSPSGGSITTSSKEKSKEDTAMVEAVKENNKVNKEVLAEIKKNNNSRYVMKMDGVTTGQMISTAGGHKTQ